MGRLTLWPATWIVRGEATGQVVLTAEPLSFWGGFDPVTGEVTDRRHQLSGVCLAGRVLAMPHGRGSCSASGVLLEAICNGVAPVAILTSRIDPIVSLGAILAEELYARVVPVAVLTAGDFDRLQGGDHLRVSLDDQIAIARP